MIICCFHADLTRSCKVDHPVMFLLAVTELIPDVYNQFHARFNIGFKLILSDICSRCRELQFLQTIYDNRKTVSICYPNQRFQCKVSYLCKNRRTSWFNNSLLIVSFKNSNSAYFVRHCFNLASHASFENETAQMRGETDGGGEGMRQDGVVRSVKRVIWLSVERSVGTTVFDGMRCGLAAGESGGQNSIEV